MSHKPNYTKYSNFSKPQEAPVVEPEVKVEEPVIDAVVEETPTDAPVVTPEPEVVTAPEAPVVDEENNNEVIGVVTGCKKLNVRKEANAEADVLTTIPEGAEVQIFDSTNGFYKVCTETGVEGYCMTKFINID